MSTDKGVPIDPLILLDSNQTSLRSVRGIKRISEHGKALCVSRDVNIASSWEYFSSLGGRRKTCRQESVTKIMEMYSWKTFFLPQLTALLGVHHLGG